MTTGLLVPGRNCWRIETAARAALLTNADYFKALAGCLTRARHEILLLGWDLEMALALDPRGAAPGCLTLGGLFDELLTARPALAIRILLWDRTVFYGGNRRSAGPLAALQERHTGLQHHFMPAGFGMSHHAKLIAIDGVLGFVGGIDLAGDRWDPADHPPRHPRRVTPEGESYGPIHDLQLMVEGPVAGAVADYARERWRLGTGEELPAVSGAPLWPADHPADFTGIPVGVARTDADTREIERLNLDAIASARHCIYLEQQYLTADSIGAALAARLEEPGGPEVIIIVTRTSNGYVEQFAMGNNRDRLLRRLQAADRHGRLHVYYPTVPDGDRRVEVKVHAKLVVIDDHFLRVGSSNLNNRSMALDTECDLAIEDGDAARRAGIRSIRDRLIADQIHVPASEVTAAIGRIGSIAAAIGALDRNGYLQKLVLDENGPSDPMPGTSWLDPTEPLTLGRLWSELVEELPAPGGRREHQAAEAERG
ncbi:MAG TPA: phospholipase D-like domain-containing protein [Aliidongia sp.]|nr:phospholipase D-like domain-containing protein [Aliidongia sp.]